jgi:hypothetical protein
LLAWFFLIEVPSYNMVYSYISVVIQNFVTYAKIAQSRQNWDNTLTTIKQRRNAKR